MFLTTLLQQRKYSSNFSVFSAKGKTFPQCGKIFGALFMTLTITIPSYSEMVVEMTEERSRKLRQFSILITTPPLYTVPTPFYVIVSRR
jgi:hypothetical protein